MTLQEALDRYIKEISGKKSSQSHDREIRLARIILDRMEATQPLVEVSPLVLDRYRDLRLKEASVATVAKDMELLKDLFRVAIALWNIPLAGNPVNALVEHASSLGRTTRMAPGERLRLVAACDHYTNPILGLVVRIVLETGLRKGEILLLKCTDIDLAGRVCQVPRIQLNAPRPVPLTKTAVKLFRRALELPDRPPDTEWIFFGDPSRFGDRKPYALDRVFKKVISSAKLKRIAFDDLRSEAIATMREAGLTEGEVAAITGSRQMKISRRAPEYQIERLLERLDALWPETPLPPPIVMEEEEEIEEPEPGTPTRKPDSRRTGGAFGQPRKF
ncbi:MAG: site-specific integrase [Magnetococcales bacterium]|nr:site-specific integrase [Magnetococcales bacterium]MBF0148862.1 site-specific integrase [Magnetococcales bacterium]MBF0173138.1 site-specific integrase [Magnetococcales bacterium]MBF0346357.1 site-specific integrase [Magnetococcales bacterium]MBF0629803.1 site-specific integrase [Magnetococcales bacterium]